MGTVPIPKKKLNLLLFIEWYSSRKRIPKGEVVADAITSHYASELQEFDPSSFFDPSVLKSGHNDDESGHNEGGQS